MIWNICRRDLIYFFTTPLAWLVLMAWTAVINLVFYWLDFAPAFTRPSTYPIFYYSINTGVHFLVLLAPALTMNSFAQERSQGTIQLLQTVPIREWELIIGKFLSCWIMLLTLILATFIQIIVLYFVSEIHGPSLLSGYLGYISLSALLASIGIWISLLVDSPIAAYVLTLGVIAILFLIGWASDGDDVLSALGDFFGISSRIRSFLSGNVTLGSFLYFIGMAFIFLILAHGALRARRIHG